VSIATETTITLTPTTGYLKGRTYGPYTLTDVAVTLPVSAVVR
jgi:hypothetical protein